MDNFYRFKIGQFTCISLSDGGFNYPVQSLFKDMPLQSIEENLAQRDLPVTHVNTPYTLLFYRYRQPQAAGRYRDRQVRCSHKDAVSRCGQLGHNAGYHFGESGPGPH